MRTATLALAILAGCSGAKDKEIAALKAQLAAQSAPASAPPPAPVAEPNDEEEASEGTKLLIRVVNEQRDPSSLARLYAETEKPENRGITYAHLKKNAARYQGRPWKTSGRILEITEGKNTVARVDVGWDSPIYVMLPGNTDFVEGAAVDVIGYLGGSFTYTSQAGWNITIPSLLAHSMVKRGALRKLAALPAK